MAVGAYRVGTAWSSVLEQIPRFPIKWILEHPRVENWIVKGVWFVIPLEYYLVTSFSAGFDKSAFGAASVFALLYLILLFAVSSLLAIAGKSEEYDRRVRVWSIALIVTWGASLIIVGVTNFLSGLAGLGNDLVGYFVCKHIWTSCVPEYPAFRAPTFLIYTIYSSIALVGLCIASRCIRATQAASPSLFPTGEGWREPDVIRVGLINALIMTAMHAWANSG